MEFHSWSGDRMAARFGQDPWAFERLDALVRHAVSRMKHGGYTRMEYDKMVEWICAYANKYGKSTMDVPKELGRNRSLLGQFHSALSGRRNDVCDGPDAFDMEKEIVANFKRLMWSAKPCSTDFGPIIEDVEQPTYICYNEEQKSAFELFLPAVLQRFLGGPGTGKTTTINGLVQAYRNVHPSDGSFYVPRPGVRLPEFGSKRIPAMTMHNHGAEMV